MGEGRKFSGGITREEIRTNGRVQDKKWQLVSDGTYVLLVDVSLPQATLQAAVIGWIHLLA